MKRTRKRKGPKPDRQKDLVYEWQWQWRDWNAGNLTVAQADKVIARACEIWEVPKPRDFRVKPGKYSVYDNSDRTITMVPEHLNTAMLLHEVSHHITEIRFGMGYEDHGAEYMGVFADLLADFNVAPRQTILQSIKAHGMKLKPVKNIPNKKGRKP